MTARMRIFVDSFSLLRNDGSEADRGKIVDFMGHSADNIAGRCLKDSFCLVHSCLRSVHFLHSFAAIFHTILRIIVMLRRAGRYCFGVTESLVF